VTTDGEGSAILMLAGNTLTVNVNYHDLTSLAVASHIHGPATEDQAAPVMVNFAPLNGGSFGTNGTLSGTVTLAPDQIAALVDGLTYVNVHTTQNPGGEIRGQILPHSTAVALTANLTGAGERPTPTTDSAGKALGLFVLDGRALHFNLPYSGLTGQATAAHIHGPAKASVAAPVLISFAPFNGGGFGTNGDIQGEVILTDDQRAMLLEGQTYANIHTQLHPGGEIRGQIVPAVMHATLLGASERPNSVQTTGHARGTFVLIGDQLTVNATYAGLSGPAVAAHIHGPADTATAAAVMVDFSPLKGEGFGISGSLSGTVTLTPDQIAALVDGLTYMNIHTQKNPGGEIRGQIIR